MSSLTDDLELRLNRAAEAAAPEAKEVFWEAIGDMTLDDVQRIYDARRRRYAVFPGEDDTVAGRAHETDRR